MNGPGSCCPGQLAGAEAFAADLHVFQRLLQLCKGQTKCAHHQSAPTAEGGQREAVRAAFRSALPLTLYFLLLCFNVLGTNRGPTDRIQYINKHSLICQVDTIDFLSEKHSLRKPPHAFGSELVKKSETVKAC